MRKVPVSGMIISDADKLAMIDAVMSGEVSYGRYNVLAEKKLAEYEDQEYALLVNSGSSANLLAMATMAKIYDLVPGDEIITTATSFPTTVGPIVQHGFVPVFVDIDNWYNIDVNEMRKAITSRTRGVFIAHTLGIPFDIEAVNQFCRSNGLFLISDCCDALGSTYRKIPVTSRLYATIVTNSFYPAHHITSGEGGAVLTSDRTVYNVAKSLRDWGRSCSCDPGKDNKCGHRFEGQFGELPKGYDHKYVYTHFGYNMKMTNVQAALLYSQLDRVEDWECIRRSNFQTLFTRLYKWAFNYSLIYGVATDYSCFRESGTSPVWFGFPILLPDGVDRNAVVQELNAKGIATRLLFSGNITKQPIWHGEKYRVSGELTYSDRVMNNFFWIGCWQGLTEADMVYAANTTFYAIEKALK
jgi:CDP-6-deoxy-D-xylo-4-hexulose-3-dehydrase